MYIMEFLKIKKYYLGNFWCINQRIKQYYIKDLYIYRIDKSIEFIVIIIMNILVCKKLILKTIDKCIYKGKI